MFWNVQFIITLYYMLYSSEKNIRDEENSGLWTTLNEYLLIKGMLEFCDKMDVKYST